MMACRSCTSIPPPGWHRMDCPACGQLGALVPTQEIPPPPAPRPAPPVAEPEPPHDGRVIWLDHDGDPT
jgi:hypothetical protein